MAWNDITTLTSQNFKAGKVLGGLSPAKDLVCVEDIRIQSLLLHTGIHSRPHLIWPCTLSLPINYHSALTHLAQLCWLSYCCLNKPSSLLDQGPYCCYPSSFFLQIIHKNGTLTPFKSLFKLHVIEAFSLIIPFKGTDWSSFFHFSSSIIFLHCIYLCLEITYFLFTCWRLVFCLRL